MDVPLYHFYLFAKLRCEEKKNMTSLEKVVNTCISFVECFNRKTFFFNKVCLFTFVSENLKLYRCPSNECNRHPRSISYNPSTNEYLSIESDQHIFRICIAITVS